MLSFLPLDVLDETWDVIESVFEGFLTYSWCINSEKLLVKIIFLITNIIVHYTKIGYNIDVLRQTTCLVVNPITLLL